MGIATENDAKERAEPRDGTAASICHCVGPVFHHYEEQD